MKKLLIILLSACLFIYGCNYKALNPVSTDTSNENTKIAKIMIIMAIQEMKAQKIQGELQAAKIIIPKQLKKL